MSGRYRVLVSLLFLCAPALAQETQPDDATGGEPSAVQIDAAVQTLRTDPNLATEKTERVLRWKKEAAKKRKEPQIKPEWMQWLENFFRWFNEAGRILMWVLGAVAAALAVWAIRAWFKRDAERLRLRAVVAPTHVQDLDIRPDSLPDDIGAAAWQQWQRATDGPGRRAALSLLYRGLLSRLVHHYEVPIKASSTEGECVALAQTVVRNRAETPLDMNYVQQLVEVWQRAVYGQHIPADANVQALCLAFAARLQSRGAVVTHDA